MIQPFYLSFDDRTKLCYGTYAWVLSQCPVNKQREDRSMASQHDDFDEDRYNRIADHVNQVAIDVQAVPGMKIPVKVGETTVIITPGMSPNELDAAKLYLYYEGNIPEDED